MAAGALRHFDFMVRDGVAREFLHPAVETEWKKLWVQLDLDQTTRQLNSQDFPSETRSSESVKKTAQNFLLFSTEVRKDWAYWSEFFGRASGLHTDLSDFLAASTATAPGTLSEKLRGQKALAENPLKLMEHLVAEVSKGLDVRAKAQRPTPSLPGRAAAAPVLDLNFSDTDGETPEKEEVEEPDAEPLEAARAKLKAFKAKSRRSRADIPAKKATLKNHCEEFQ
ncbi:unnamed protein product [Prorocentrum cordatum]|uniref:Uncharacterized protein n=1 Tax=Prorocentrum cordatum TaxID=2364126 RepID=A0ABN9YB19_9DINO|nr:unnamed protein product [Polarella glacialis]